MDKLKRFKVTQKPLPSYDSIVAGTALPARGPRFEGEIETFQNNIDISGEGYSLYLKFRWASGEEIQLAYLDVNLKQAKQGRYTFTADRYFHIMEGEDFWNKMERLQQADKQSYKAHETFGYAREQDDIVGKGRRIVPADDRRFDNISTRIRYKPGPSEEVKMNNEEDFNTPGSRPYGDRWVKS